MSHWRTAREWSTSIFVGCKPMTLERGTSMLLRCSDSRHCHLSGWSRVIAHSYGHQSHYLWAHQDGEIKGVLPTINYAKVVFSPLARVDAFS